MKKTTIPIKTAIGMWRQDFRGMYDEIKEVKELPVSKTHYNRFLNNVRKHPHSSFSTMIITGDEIKRKDFIVGLDKVKGRWIVDKKKFLIALNKKREIHKDGVVEDKFEMALQHLGVKRNICFEDIIIPDKN